jgi:anaerobic selenocysteine-containing dehydrogenase
MKRREFIILTGVGAPGTTLLSACGHPEEKLIPAFIPDDQYVPGIDYWKASTCGMCPAGCGIIVRTREHKANKIEGNPLHPINRGALCARGQAGLEVLYNPDRIKGPMKRVGERGEGKWEEISWDEAIKTLADKLREIDPNSSTEKALFLTADAEGVTAGVAGRFMQTYRQAFVAQPSHGQTELPGFYADLLRGVVNLGEAIPDIANATYLVSFGARFLETWKSPVMYSQAYGEFRSSRGKTRGRFVHVEPRMSLTAANADEWVAAAPGAEALVALAMIQVVVRERLNKAPLTADSAGKLEEFSPESTASVTDVPPEKIIRVAREFARAERPLAIGDLQSPGDSAVNLLNTIVQNLNKPGGVLLVESQDKPNRLLKVPGGGLILPGVTEEQLEKPSIRESVERLSGVFQMLQHPYLMMIHGFNPMFASHGGREELLATPFIVSFSSFMDETSELADLILPDHIYLERWDLHTSFGPDGGRVVSLTQPVLEPQLNTRQTADVLLAVAREIGGEVAEALPFDSAKGIIEKGAVDLVNDAGGSAEAAWSELTERGQVSAGSPSAVKLQPAEPAPISLDPYRLGLLRRSASAGATNAEYPLTLIVYEHAAFGDGSAANLPSIQELPDSMTSVMWGSWVEMNPKTAASLGIADADLVEIRTTKGAITVPAVLYKAIRPDVIAMPYGQGHEAYGRYANGRGANAAWLNPLSLTAQEITVRAKVIKVGAKARLIRFGTELQERMEKRR